MMFSCRLPSFSLVSVMIAMSPAMAQWTQWRGSERNGRVTSDAWPSKLNGAIQQRWTSKLGPSYSGPVMLDGTVFTTETIDKQTERVTAYSLADGSVEWQHEWPGYMAVPFFAAANGDWIRSTPAVVPGALVILGMRDVLVCLDPESGNEQWKIDFPQQYGQPMQAFGAVCSPLIHDGAVFVQLGGGLTKVDLETGEVQWQVLDDTAGMSGGAFSSPSLATIDGQLQLLVQTRQELCGVDLQSGAVYWREAIEAFRGMNILTPLAIGDTVFTAAHSGQSQLFGIDRASSVWSVDESWNQKSQGYMSSPVEVDGNIYLHAKSERFQCINSTDGSIEWTSRPVGKYWSMVHNDKSILALASDGELRLIDASPESFQVTDQIRVADDSWAHLAIDGSTIVIRSLDALSVYDWK
ncbi:MAG: PQQ-binding-like beta-propeller repeat protein [Planctomycetota bacterium]